MVYPVSSSFPDIQQRTMEEEEACVVVMVMSCQMNNAPTEDRRRRRTSPFILRLAAAGKRTERNALVGQATCQQMLMNKRTFSSHCHKYQMPSLRLRNSCCASSSYRSCAALFAEHRRDTVMTKQRGRECYKGMEKHENSRVHVIGKGFHECAVIVILEARNSFVRPYRNFIFLFRRGSILLAVGHIYTRSIYTQLCLYIIQYVELQTHDGFDIPRLVLHSKKSCNRPHFFFEMKKNRETLLGE